MLLSRSDILTILAALVLLLVAVFRSCVNFAIASNHAQQIQAQQQQRRDQTRTEQQPRRDHNNSDDVEDRDDDNNKDINSDVGSVTFIGGSFIMITLEISPPHNDQVAAIMTRCGGESCSICLEDFKLGDECRVFLACGHAHHRACIDSWLSLHKQCPLCRQSIR